MTEREKLSQIARAYLVEAQAGYEAVPALIQIGRYNLAIYHAQQAVEKLLKVALALEGKIGIYKHEVFAFFRETFSGRVPEEWLRELEDDVVELKRLVGHSLAVAGSLRRCAPAQFASAKREMRF